MNAVRLAMPVVMGINLGSLLDFKRVYKAWNRTATPTALTWKWSRNWSAGVSRTVPR